MVGLRERVVFVIMAAAARHGEPEESTAGGFSEIGQPLRASAILFVESPGGVVLGAEPQKTRGNKRILLR